ncbi:MAG: hypothetical protein ACFFD1_03895 [Candidatus Thorarchaeota archaeon]
MDKITEKIDWLSQAKYLLLICGGYYTVILFYVGLNLLSPKLFDKIYSNISRFYILSIFLFILVESCFSLVLKFPHHAEYYLKLTGLFYFFQISFFPLLLFILVFPSYNEQSTHYPFPILLLDYIFFSFWFSFFIFHPPLLLIHFSNKTVNKLVNKELKSEFIHNYTIVLATLLICILESAIILISLSAEGG